MKRVPEVNQEFVEQREEHVVCGHEAVEGHVLAEERLELLEALAVKQQVDEGLQIEEPIVLFEHGHPSLVGADELPILFWDTCARQWSGRNGL